MENINKEKLVEKLTNIADGFRTSRSLTETLSLDEMATLAAVPITSGDNKLAQLVDGITPFEITAEDLEGATKIRNYAFYYYAGLTSIIIPDSVTSIGSSAFNYCTGLTNVIIPDSVISIESEAFRYCTGLTNVIIGNNVTSIGNYAFYQCTGFTSIVIPNSVTNINDNAFEFCSKLTNITISNGVRAIGSYALRCGSATNTAIITFLGRTPPTIKTTTFRANFINKIIVPKGCGEAYKTATNWANFADYIEEASV